MKIKLKLLSILTIALLLSACGAPSFTIVPAGDKFSNDEAPYGFIGKNNRLSTKSTKGGTHIDSKGVYLEPYAFRDKKTNKIVSVGFYITHYNYEPSDGFRPIKSIVFLTDSGDKIETQVKSIDSDFSIGNWNAVSKEYNSTYNESGNINMQLQDFKKLANSKWIEVKINGRERSQTYNKNEVSSSFTANLNAFYKSKVQ